MLLASGSPNPLLVNHSFVVIQPQEFRGISRVRGLNLIAAVY
jgi:hypothetical protein